MSCCRHDAEEESHKKHKKKKEKKRSLSPPVEVKVKKKEKVMEEPDATVPRCGGKLEFLLLTTAGC